MLKKMGAMTPPMMTPPRRLLGTKGMSSPMAHWHALQADLRDEPVPTTSPTKATWKPAARYSAMVFRPAREAGLAHGQGVERDVRAGGGVAGRREVVGVDLAVDRKTLTFMVAGTPWRAVNHSASAQDSSTFLASAFLALASASTSSKAS